MRRSMEDRYHIAIRRLGGPEGISRLPEEVKKILRNATDLEVKVEALETFAHIHGDTSESDDYEIAVRKFIRNVRCLAGKKKALGALENYAGVRAGYLSRQSKHIGKMSIPLLTALKMAEFVGESVDDLCTRDDYIVRDIDAQIEDLQTQIEELQEEKKRRITA